MGCQFATFAASSIPVSLGLPSSSVSPKSAACSRSHFISACFGDFPLIADLFRSPATPELPPQVSVRIVDVVDQDSPRNRALQGRKNPVFKPRPANHPRSDFTSIRDLERSIDSSIASQTLPLMSCSYNGMSCPVITPR